MGYTDTSFLTTILANPEDESHRLIYADWLEEQAEPVRECSCRMYGHPGWVVGMKGKWERCDVCRGTSRINDGRQERAEFIRVQCKLAGLEAVRPSHCEEQHNTNQSPGHWCDLCAWNEKAFPLHRRERELLEGPNPNTIGASWSFCPDHVKAWMAGLPGKVPTLSRRRSVVSVGREDGVDGPPKEYAFRRGFVENVTCTATDWLDHTHIAVTLQPIMQVTLSDREPDGDGPDRHPWFWLFSTTLRGRWQDVPNHLPKVLWMHLAGGALIDLGPVSSGYDTWCRYFETREEALAALSAACISWAKAVPLAEPDHQLGD